MQIVATRLNTLAQYEYAVVTIQNGKIVLNPQQPSDEPTEVQQGFRTLAQEVFNYIKGKYDNDFTNGYTTEEVPSNANIVSPV